MGDGAPFGMAAVDTGGVVWVRDVVPCEYGDGGGSVEVLLYM